MSFLDLPEIEKKKLSVSLPMSELTAADIPQNFLTDKSI